MPKRGRSKKEVLDLEDASNNKQDETNEIVEDITPEQQTLRDLFNQKNHKKIQYIRVLRFPTDREIAQTKSALPLFLCELNTDEYPEASSIYEKIQQLKPSGGKFKIIPLAENHSNFTGQSKIIVLDGVEEKPPSQTFSNQENPSQLGDTITKIYSMISQSQQSDTIAEKYNNLVNLYQREMQNTLNGVKELSGLKTNLLEENMKMRDDFHTQQIKMIQQINDQNMKVMEMMGELKQTDDIPGWLKIVLETVAPYVPAIAKGIKNGTSKIGKIASNIEKKPQVVVDKANVQIFQNKDIPEGDEMIKQNFIWIIQQIKKGLCEEEIAEMIYARAILGKKKKDLWDLVNNEDIEQYLKSILPDLERDLKIHQAEIQNIIIILGEYLEPEFEEKPEEIPTKEAETQDGKEEIAH